MDNVIKEITDIIICETVNKRIPTVVFLSEIEKEELVKNIIYTMKGGGRDESLFTGEDWDKVVEIMQTLAEIPLLVRNFTDIGEIKTSAEDFICELDTKQGIVIINSADINENCFTTNENISIIVLGGSKK